eukprot:2647040-Rhodomonas_salina.4
MSTLPQVLGGMLMYPSVAQRAQGYICDGRDEEMEIFCGKDQDIKDAVSAVCLGAVLLTLLIAATITLHSVRQSRDSKKAMRIIDDAFQRSRYCGALSPICLPACGVSCLRLCPV